MVLLFLSDEDNSGALSGGSITGIVIGVVITVLLISVIALLIRRGR